MQKFSVAGVSGDEHGSIKVRFANDIVARTKLFQKSNHNPLELLELPKPMTKAEACQYLLDQGGVFTKYKDLITETLNKKEGVPAAPKAAKATTAKAPAKAKTPAKKPAKVVKTKAEEKDEELAA